MHTKEVKSILSAQNGMNLCRGCTHGCIYCDARSNCYQMKHKFEDVEIKLNAPDLLETALRSKRKKCMISTGAMSDPYLPEERELKLTRRCVELIEHYGFGLAIQTKSDLILRDLDLLKKINRKTKCVVQMTLTTYDEELCKVIEPNVCSTKRRAEVLNILRDEGIPTVVWLSPLLPYINDTEENIRGILKYCFDAKIYGMLFFGVGLTLRDGNREYFYRKLEEHFPGLKHKYEKTYGYSYEILSPNHNALSKIVYEECIKHQVICNQNKVFEYLHQFEDKQSGEQLSIFDL